METKENINVLHLVSSLKVGGLEKLLVEFIKSSQVNAQGINFVVMVMNDQVSEEMKNELLSTKYKIYFLNRKQGHKHLKYLFNLFKIIKENDINMIHTHNYGSKNWSVLCKFFKPSLNLVYTIHSSMRGKKEGRIDRTIQKLFVDSNIAISDEIFKIAQKKRFKNVVKIYNGVDVKKFSLSNKKQKNDVFKIINIGRLTHKIKGQDVLINALGRCKKKGINFKCDIVGGVYDYDNDSLEYLKELVKENKLENEINFLGNREDITQLLCNSNLFVLPSRYEGMPISILEAMAANVPVIASNISGSNDIIINEKNGLLFESENYIELAEKIIELFNNQAKLNLLAKNAYNYVQKFDISNMCKNYCELYKKLLNE